MTSMDDRRIRFRLSLLVLSLGLVCLFVLVVGVRQLLVGRGVQVGHPTPVPTATIWPSPTPLSTPTIWPSPTPMPNLVTSAPPAFRFGTVLISDTLASAARGTLDEGSAEAAEYRFAEGAYHISVKPAAYLAWSPLEDMYDDAAIEVDTRLISGPPPTAFGIIFRFQDEDNFYFYNISADGYYALDLKKNGRWSALLDWAKLPTSSMLQRRLRVELAGERIRLFLNGTLLDETSDDSFRRGRIALAVNTFDQGNAIVAFRNLLLQNKASPKDQP